jgi:hypothetical protein
MVLGDILPNFETNTKVEEEVVEEIHATQTNERDYPIQSKPNATSTTSTTSPAMAMRTFANKYYDVVPSTSSTNFASTTKME